jgi:cytidylate kinase
MYRSIAIDGPAGAGKSTIAKKVAADLEFIYVDTGAMYRSMALYFLRAQIKADHIAEIEEACDDINVVIQYTDGMQQVILNGENVTGLIRTEEVGNMASAIAVIPAVRMKLVELQRELANNANVIMDGRDIGTYVLPNADLKIYLTASSAERASRRYKELTEKGIQCDINEIEADIIERDKRDMNREFAPLRQAEDAVLVDSSNMTIDQVVSTIIRAFSEK